MAEKAYTLQECRDETRAFYRARNRVSIGVVTHAIESLTSPEDIKAYFKVLHQIFAAAVRKAHKAGEDTAETRKIRTGVSIAKAAETFAYDSLRSIINQYNPPEWHVRWNRALPELKSNGGLATLL